ncbi:MAG: hypothetical protein HC774_03720 [Sphingomonadales bacterium]|nr:hypothetical protein [Sphingomonadales bacterium]
MPYIIESINYERNPTGRDMWGPMKTTITMDGVSFEGMYKLRSDLLIDKDWSITVGEPVPNTIETYDSKPNNLVRNKIYAKTEFFAAMDAVASTPDQAPVWQAPQPITLPTFESAALEQAAAALKAQYMEYFRCADPDRQFAIQRGQLDAINPLLEVYSKSANTLSKADIETYSALSGGAGGEIWRGARVLPK